MKKLALITGLAAAFAFVGCVDSDHASHQVQTVPPPSQSNPAPTQTDPPQIASSDYDWQGYFSGYIRTTLQGAGNDYYGEALLTADGALVVYVDYWLGNTVDGQPAEMVRYEFIGTIDDRDDVANSAHITGRMIRLTCSADVAGPPCGESIPADGQLTDVTDGYLHGQIDFSTADGDYSWKLSMEWPTSTYTHAATMNFVAGLYSEALADFAHEGDVVINVDTAGTMFFQSAHTGCTGNGLLTPHLDGATNVYDVTLRIESCDATYAYLNTDFVGYATRTIGDWLLWGDWLVFWLATPESAQNTAALTMWGERH